MNQRKRVPASRSGPAPDPSTPESATSDYVTADVAIKVLAIRRQTLYAYVSRGWIRSVNQPGRRRRLYLRDDVERMRSRSQARLGHAAVAASAMNWGEPIIPTSITEITPAGPCYRGRGAIELAQRGVKFERVAELLWSGMWHEEPVRWPVATPPREISHGAVELRHPLESTDQVLEHFALTTLRLGMLRGTAADRILAGKTIDAARQLIQVLAGSLGHLTRARKYLSLRAEDDTASGVVRALGCAETPESYDAIRTMLILFADHELSPAALAARVTASSGATLHSCIASAICASSGARLGRVYDYVMRFLESAATASALMRRAQELQERGNVVPGFNHPLYPHGDPRGLLLLEMAARYPKQSKQLETICRFVDQVDRTFGLHPRHELGVVALGMALGIPRLAPGALFVVARTAGWVAHIQEQRLSGMLLRPRAKYVGPATAVSADY